MSLGFPVAALAWAIWRTAFWTSTLIAAAALAAAWWVDVLLISSSTGDLSGVMDCYPDCSTSQDAANALLYLAPASMIGLVVVVIASAAMQVVRGSRRARETPRPGPNR
jgi:hypothetical protein